MARGSVSRDDPAFEGKLKAIIISMIIENEKDEEIVYLLVRDYGFGKNRAIKYLKDAKKTIKYYKSADLELCIKIHAQRYEEIESYARKLGMPSILLRAIKAHNALLDIEGGDLALALRGSAVKALDKNKVEISPEGIGEDVLEHLSLEDSKWLTETLNRIKR